MSQQESTSTASYTLDASTLPAAAITTVRIGLGVVGLIALVIGVLMTFWPVKTAVALTWLLAIYWIVAGAGYVLFALFTKGMKTAARVIDVILGVLMVAAGVIVLSNPSESALFLGIFLGIWIGILWVAEGVVTLVQSWKAPNRGWSIFFGALSILAGIAVFTSPLWGVLVLLWWTGIGLIVLGVLQLVRAFTFGRGAAPAA